MGGLCSRNSPVGNSPAGSLLRGNGHVDYGYATCQSGALPEKAQTKLNPPSVGENMDRQLQEPFSFGERIVSSYGNDNDRIGLEPGEPQLTRALSNKSRSTKPKPAIAGKMGTAKASPSSLSSIMLCIVSNFHYFFHIE